jgi:hypothetical protein
MSPCRRTIHYLDPRHELRKYTRLLPVQLRTSRMLLPSADMKKYLGPTSVTQKEVSLSSSKRTTQTFVKMF